MRHAFLEFLITSLSLVERKGILSISIFCDLILREKVSKITMSLITHYMFSKPPLSEILHLPCREHYVSCSFTAKKSPQSCILCQPRILLFLTQHGPDDHLVVFYSSLSASPATTVEIFPREETVFVRVSLIFCQPQLLCLNRDWFLVHRENESIKYEHHQTPSPPTNEPVFTISLPSCEVESFFLSPRALHPDPYYLLLGLALSVTHTLFKLSTTPLRLICSLKQ